MLTYDVSELCASAKRNANFGPMLLRPPLAEFDAINFKHIIFMICRRS